MAMQKEGSVQLVDVRSVKEFELNPICQDAINIPVDEIETRTSEPDTFKNIVLFCSSGQRTGLAYEKIINRNSTYILVNSY